MNYYNYFTEIEEHFVMRRGKHLLISPMDWNLIAAWRDAGVPLHVALRGIDIAMDGFLARKGGGSSRVNSLCYCHDAIMEAYAAYIEAHVGESSADGAGPATLAEDDSAAENGPGAEKIILFLSARIGEITALGAKQYQGNVPEGIGRAIARLDEIIRALQQSGRVDAEALERDLALVDNLLLTALRADISAEETLEWEKEAKKELKVYKKRLPKTTYEKIHDNFLRDKVRRRFCVGELSLFNL
ncbi:MAG TPA: hypothetical protein VLL97_09255 [Acidobacteriota bacterium]|nr:hypothetical protein [Acidobacteriota bacterium]